jgi:hypothetical protein
VDRAQEGLTVREISPAAAAIALAGCEDLDPRGLMAPGDVQQLVDKGRCFSLTGSQAGAVYVLTVRNGVVWIDALKGAGDVDLVELVDGVITAQSEGLEAIALQTKRRGLVRKLERHGYRVTGWVMRKELQ